MSFAEAADFVAPRDDVLRLTHSEENRRFVAELSTAAKTNGIWIEAGVHQPVSPNQSALNVPEISTTEIEQCLTIEFRSEAHLQCAYID